MGAASRLHGPPVHEVLPVVSRQLLQLVVVGGEGPDGSSRSSCECLSAGAGAWRPLPPVHTRRAGCAAVAVAGAVYAIGGSDGASMAADSVERFHPSTGMWEPVPPMHAKRVGCAAAG